MVNKINDMAKKVVKKEVAPKAEAPKATVVSTTPSKVDECVDKLISAINGSDLSTFRKAAALRQINMIKRSCK